MIWTTTDINLWNHQYKKQDKKHLHHLQKTPVPCSLFLPLQATSALLFCVIKSSRHRWDPTIWLVLDSGHSAHLCLRMLLWLTWVTPTHPAGRTQSPPTAFGVPSPRPSQAWVRGSGVCSFCSLHLSLLCSIMLLFTRKQMLTKCNHVPGTVVGTREERVSKELF